MRVGKLCFAAVVAAVVFVVAAPGALAAGAIADRDARTGVVKASAQQAAAVERLGARASWNRYGTPSSLIARNGYLARGVQGATAVDVARAFLREHGAIFRLGADSASRLQLVRDARLGGNAGHAVILRQTFGGLPAAEGGLVVVGLKGDRVAYVSGSVAGDATLEAQPRLTAAEAWAVAARDVGIAASLPAVRATREADGWTLLGVAGLAQPQRARLVAVPTPLHGVRPAWETLVVDPHAQRAYTHFVDAASGAVIVRRDLVESLVAPSTFTGTVPPADGACAPDNGPFVVGPTETVGSVVVTVAATVTANDTVIHLVRNGTVVASQDTATSPEALAYSPLDNGQGTYFVRVCDFSDGAAWTAPTTYTGQIAFNPVTVDGDFPYPPKWKAFPNTPQVGLDAPPWNYPSTDTRQTWCWDTTIGNPPTTVPGCQLELQSPASPAPWDYSHRTNTPTFTTVGNNAVSAEAWGSPLTAGPTGYRPVALDRNYSFPWTNVWHTSKCFTPFVPGQSHDIGAAVTNLFAMHNRMHDWSYRLGFTEEHWNAQESNLGRGPTAGEHDPVIGNAQAGALDGGFPSYEGRDNANMIALPDGVPPMTNMYLWQPIAGAFYPPCVDGDFDMSVIGHEYGHLIENRMIGKGGTRGGDHAGAMGESFGDFDAAEYVNAYGYAAPGTNPFAVGPYATGNKQRGIRNYALNWPRTGAFPESGTDPQINPLNLSNFGYDNTGAEVHTEGEIWSAVNYDIRQALATKYNGVAPATNAALQRDCADGKRPVEQCPGNRRWIQLVYDAMLLMPTAPSMLDARDAYLAADRLRFGGANQTELWKAFATRGFGEGASSTNAFVESDTDPAPDFAAPGQPRATVTFVTTGNDTKAAAPARIFVGHYEARISPVADTDPATSGSPNLDATASFVPGVYEFAVQAKGYGLFRIRKTLAAGAQTLTLNLQANWASQFKGATASGDGADVPALIDDTEATNWGRTGATPDVRGSQVTVDLSGSTRAISRVQVSAMLTPEQNRWTALRQFELQTCSANVSNANCTSPTGWTTRITSPANAFPGSVPRPLAPQLIMRSFTLPRITVSHVRIVVLTNQCTGNPAFQGEQDADPLSGSDCRQGSPGGGTVEVFGDLPQVLAQRDDEVHIAELQVFSG
jgi:hypothetical protein